LESSQAETQRLEMELRRGAAAVVEQYQTAQFTVERYRRTILPQTEKLYQMQQGAWQRMAVSYPEVLMAQQSLFSTQAEYIRALQNLRTNAVALSGFLLTDGTIAPGMAKSQ
jgi:outer membrane protein TolC